MYLEDWSGFRESVDVRTLVISNDCGSPAITFHTTKSSLRLCSTANVHNSPRLSLHLHSGVWIASTLPKATCLALYRLTPIREHSNLRELLENASVEYSNLRELLENTSVEYSNLRELLETLQWNIPQNCSTT